MVKYTNLVKYYRSIHRDMEWCGYHVIRCFHPFVLGFLCHLRRGHGGTWRLWWVWNIWWKKKISKQIYYERRRFRALFRSQIAHESESRHHHQTHVPLPCGTPSFLSVPSGAHSNNYNALLSEPSSSMRKNNMARRMVEGKKRRLYHNFAQKELISTKFVEKHTYNLSLW